MEGCRNSADGLPSSRSVRGAFKSYAQFHDSEVFSAAAIAAIYGVVDPKNVRRFEVPELSVVKISYARPSPQGGVIERDMHSGQQYARLLQLDLGPPSV